MKLERAIDILENFTGYSLIYPDGRFNEIPNVDEALEAVSMAIEALKRECRNRKPTHHKRIDYIECSELLNKERGNHEVIQQ